jgi:deoxyribodipyrimidine photolyase
VHKRKQMLYHHAMQTAIWWLRRDLRLDDNPALATALEQAEQVLPVFILDEKLLQSSYSSERRTAFLLHGLQQLDGELKERGSRLVVRRGDPLAELAGLVHETGAEAIFAEADYSPYARRRDQRIAAELPLQLLAGVTVHPPGTVLKPDGKPYTIFTPFSRAWQALPLPGGKGTKVDRLNTPAGIAGLEVDALIDTLKKHVSRLEQPKLSAAWLLLSKVGSLIMARHAISWIWMALQHSLLTCASA